jgi:agmatinase
MQPTLLGVPYDAGSSYLRGAADAPALIRRALFSPASNLWTETRVDLGAGGPSQTGGCVLGDAGDAEVPAASPREAIEAAVRRLLEDGRRPIVLGGDHSITYPVLRAVRAGRRPLSVLHFDAHPDLYEEFERDRYSHACPFARVMEDGLADQLVQVGVRTMNGHQRAQAERYGVEVIEMREWVAGRRPAVAHPVYVSIDVDALDPAFAPGVSHREPGGLSVRDILDAVHALTVPLVGADVVEFNPGQDAMGLTAPVCAKLVKEVAGQMLK